MTAAVRGTVAITGGTSGVGRAAARAFADRGHPVGVLARGEAALAATEAELRVLGVPALGLCVDVTDRDALDDAADVLEADLGPIEVWVNSAMVTVLGEFERIEPEDFDRVMAVVFGGAANGTRSALRCMRPRDRGRIVQVGSALAYRGIPLQSAYCAGKHAVQGLSDSVRAELLHSGSAITVSEVNLPAMNTPQFDMCKNLLEMPAQPVPPIFQPEVAAEAIVYAARTGDRAVNVTSVAARTILADRLFPGALDVLLADTGYEAQVVHRAAPTREDNLWEPLAGDHGCHGAFDARARPSSRQEQLRTSPIGSTVRRAGVVGRRLAARMLRPLV